MMDAVVQFLRNALCCCKDLDYFAGTWLHDAGVTNTYLLGLPEPLDTTTPLEVLISFTQLYACLSTALAGVSFIWYSVGKMRRVVRLLERRLTVQPETKTSTTTRAANRIVNESLMQQAKNAIRGVIVGFLVAPIGIAFSGCLPTRGT